MTVGHTCGYMDIQGVQYSLVPSSITPDTYVLLRLRLFRCPIVFKSLFNQNFHSRFPCDLFVARKGTGEAGQATGDNQTAVITAKRRQTVDEIQGQQRSSTVGGMQTGDPSPVT